MEIPPEEQAFSAFVRTWLFTGGSLKLRIPPEVCDACEKEFRERSSGNPELTVVSAQYPSKIAAAVIVDVIPNRMPFVNNICFNLTRAAEGYWECARNFGLFPCPLPPCQQVINQALIERTRQHFSISHGIDPRDKKETNDFDYLHMKDAHVKMQHILHDARKLNAWKVRVQNAEQRIVTAGKPGFNAAMNGGVDLQQTWPSQIAELQDLDPLRLTRMLSSLRTDLAYKQNEFVGSMDKWESLLQELETEADLAELLRSYRR